MSRIIVKNLPKNINENDIKKHFSVKGEVTDVKIMKKDNGKSRNFCFVGFRDENSAKDAVNYFNKTFLKTSKIDVEIAKIQGDPSLKKNKGKKNKFNDDNNTIKQTKESKIKKILELSKITKNSSKFDKVLENKNKENNNNLNENENETELEKNNNNEETKESNDNNEKNLDPKRLYLRNLPFQISENDLQKAFEKFGTISDIHIPINHKTNESFGYAYITFETVESCVMALSKMDESFFMGRKLHIEIAEEKTTNQNKNNIKNTNENKIKENKKLSSFKSEKISQLKQNYSNKENWNYLFLNQNAVIDSISSRLNIPKSELLNKDNPDIAIQISAMETKIINETKEWLLNEGINLEILKGKRQNCTRSNTIIFVKNISNKTNKETLQKYFERYGSLIRFLISPSNTLAICEYVNKKHALNAMKHLSYQEIDGLPLYLEFAPEGIVDNENNKNINVNENEKNINNENVIDLNKSKGKILFVTNLSFSTTEKQLKHFFESKDYHINKVEIAKHKKDNKNVSSGFGFCEFKTEEDMLKAIKNLNNHLLGGHSIKLSIAKTSNENNNFLGMKRKNETELNDYEYNNKNIDNSKLLIKNVAFEANKEELRKLFKVYGNIKTLRLPLKLDGTHRGFAFVEFISHDEAQKAFKELQNTHFYGRKLVIEWAQTNKSIEKLREETLKKSNLINVQTHRKLNKGKIIIKK